MNPINKGVFSGTCGSGGVFHEGIGGRSEDVSAEAARGKLSTMSGAGLGCGLYIGAGGTCSDW